MTGACVAGGAVGASVGASVAGGFVGASVGASVGGGFVGGGLVGRGCGVLVGGTDVVSRFGRVVKVMYGCVAVGVIVKVEVSLGVVVSSSVAEGYGVSEGCKGAIAVNDAVGLKNIWANACLVCTWAVLIVGLGEIVTSKRSPACVSLTLPPETSMGIPKLMPAMMKIATNNRLFLMFILQAFPVVPYTKVLQGL